MRRSRPVVARAGALAALALVLPLLAGCGGEDEAGERVRAITARAIGPLSPQDDLRVGRVIVSRGVRGCGEMVGVATDDDGRGHEFLILCSDAPTPAMREDYGAPGWTPHTVYMDRQVVMPGNLTRHCRPVPSQIAACQGA
ncbi:hypothetical protein [Rhodospirillum centenum]|uniref:Lipoprotein n=1 Tax=Rhodospirillum centenum (strain ATCC 51521 / SW) TaxID=414684 RepID=B6IUT3_RHOCS|nr:hypothetical protein [Rhodospirillum centenum]ACJ00015.1 hypothetical protein RC1_2640 [Rhodospirillum centenum SW]